MTKVYVLFLKEKSVLRYKSHSCDLLLMGEILSIILFLFLSVAKLVEVFKLKDYEVLSQLLAIENL